MDREALQRKIGNAIRARRDALEISQEAMADKFGMHRAYYSAIERGAKNMELGTLLRVAQGLGSDVFDLFEAARKASTTIPKWKPPGRRARNVDRPGATGRQRQR